MSKEILNKVAVKARQMILDNVAKGIDINGKEYQYSDKPFARPYDSKLKGVKNLVKEKRLKLFHTKAGALWMVVNGGYKDYRLMKGKSSTGDFLTVTGAMLRNLKVIETTDTNAKLGFTDAVQTKKALWFNVMGVGRGKKLWEWLGLRKEQQEGLAEFAATLLTEKYIEDLFKKGAI